MVINMYTGGIISLVLAQIAALDLVAHATHIDVLQSRL